MSTWNLDVFVSQVLNDMAEDEIAFYDIPTTSDSEIGENVP